MVLASRVAGALVKLHKPEFKYRPLDQPTFIRLVKLAPKSHDHLIHCTLVDADLSANPHYEALSYTWAMDHDLSEPSNSDSKRILICSNTTIEIFQNLWNALAQLQELGWTSVPLWIDAVCINQCDDVEKSTRVNMMGDIFRAASRVIVWLGRSSIATEMALNKTEQYNFANVGKKAMTGTSLSTHEIISTSIMLAALKWVLSRGWFARVWTLQEAVLARDIIYVIGARVVPFPRLLEAGLGGGTDVVVGGSTRVQRRANGLNFIRTAHKWLHDDSIGICTLETALKEARNRRSADGRDQLFSVLALCRRGGLGDAAHLTADYRKSIQDVYGEAAVALLHIKATGIFMLSLVGQLRSGCKIDYVFNSSFIKSCKPRNGFVKDLPSWIPDLSAPTKPIPFRDIEAPVITGATVNFSAASSLSPSFAISSANTRLLQLKAALLDTIATTGDCLTERSVKFHVWRLFRLPLKLLEISRNVYATTNESVISAFQRTLLAGVTNSWDGTEITDRHFVEWFAIFAQTNHVTGDYEMLESLIIDREDLDLDEAEEPDDRDHIHLWDIAAQLKYRKQADRYKIETLRKFLAAFDSPAYGMRYAIEERCKLIKNFNTIDEFEEDTTTYMHPFRYYFERRYVGRRMFITEKGYMGTGPWTAVDGDVVMLVAGAYVPYVFRRSTKTHGAWELVGEAYCHGFMHGEGLDKDGITFDMIDVV